MHVTRPPGLPALAVVVPHPRPRSSVSSLLSSPRTPRTPSCSSNTLFTSTTNRNSTDSWTSSNAAEELKFDWKPEQVRLLSRTLDALPAHLVTPFNGPIPPSNLLDKIARGVSEAKGPIDWPHSLRATRVKLIELSRARAKEEQGRFNAASSDIDMDDPAYIHYPDGAGKGITGKRPLYRQSSMDFMNAAELRDNDNIPCLSDRLISKPGYHPYSRGRLSSSACSAKFINPSSPSSSTLNSLSSFSSANRMLRRTSSNISSTSASSILSSNGAASCVDIRMQRLRRSGSFCAPAPPPKDIRLAPSLHKENLQDSPTIAGMKRAPSFGTLAQEVRRDRQVFGGALKANTGDVKDTSAYPSSDEEEKIRSVGAKKMRVKDTGLAPAASVNTGPPPKTPPSALSGSGKRMRAKAPGTAPACVDCKSVASPKSPAKPKSKSKEGEVRKPGDPNATAATKDRKKRPVAPMNLHRNPSIIGAELSHLRGSLSSSAPVSEPGQSRLRVSPPHSLASPPPELSPGLLPASPPGSPQKVRTLRRVQRLTLGRRISFGSLVPPGDDADGEAEGDDDESSFLRKARQRQRELGQLGSAFQLH